MPVKPWLQCNEIYFKTICYVVVTLAALSVAGSQSRMAENAVPPLVRDSLPDIHVVKLIDDATDSGRRDSVLHVINTGGPAFDLRCEPLVYLVFGVGSYIVLDGFYEPNLVPDAVRGPMATLSAPGNSMLLHRLLEHYESLCEARGLDTRFKTLQPYLRVSYLDKFRNRHCQYFRIEDRAVVFDSQLGERIFSGSEAYRRIRLEATGAGDLARALGAST